MKQLSLYGYNFVKKYEKKKKKKKKKKKMMMMMMIMMNYTKHEKQARI